MSRLHHIFWMATPEPGNSGDLVTPWLYRKDTGNWPSASLWANDSIVGCGSIVHLAARGSTVWGSGIVDPTRRFKAGVNPSLIRVSMVRGPRTDQWLWRMGAPKAPADVPYMDPGFLVPRFCPEDPIAYERNLLFIPHYVDYKRVSKVMGDRVTVLNPVCGLAGMDEYFRTIRSSELVVASTLHGLIFAIAFGCRAIWARWSNNINGGDYKYCDMAESIGLRYLPCADLRYAPDDPSVWLDSIQKVDPIEEDYLWKKYKWENMLDRAWEVRPWA